MDLSPLPRVPFFFLRHGETDWNRQKRYMGQQDIPLNAHGRAQAEQAAQHLQGRKLSRIITSPLKRAYETATIIASTYSLPVLTHDGLKECYGGAMEGKVYTDNDLLRRWAEGENISNAENITPFSQRVLRTFTDLLESNTDQLFISHGGVWWILSTALALRVADIENGIPYYVCPLASSPYWGLKRIMQGTCRGEDSDTQENE